MTPTRNDVFAPPGVRQDTVVVGPPRSLEKGKTTVHCSPPVQLGTKDHVVVLEQVPIGQQAEPSAPGDYAAGLLNDQDGLVSS